MSKLLNMLENTSLAGVHGAGSTGQSAYVSSVPRAALGFAGVAMAVITIAAAVILPARYDSRNPVAPLQLTSQTASSASDGGAIMSITVVAAREPRSSTAPLRIVEAAPRPEPAVETAPSATFRVSSVAR